MTEQWGAPLAGAQMKLLRVAGLKDSDEVQTITWGGVWHGYQIGGIINLPDDAKLRLPANHIAYTLLNAGWLDGRNVRLWNGGETAPDDLADGSPVLLQGGKAYQASKVTYWEWDGDNGDIIAYIAKAEVRTSPDTHSDRTIGRGLPDLPETVTIAKMTPDEIMERFNIPADEHQRPAFGRGAWTVLELLGLIKPEPTREERFWALHEPEGTTVPTHIKKWVKNALEFER